ncbi:MAG TPA: FAD-linked oxidase C-terminal domain-containing protein [Micrococcaceae bacterium]
MSQDFVDSLRAVLPAAQLTTAPEQLRHYAVDQGPVTDFQLPVAVAWARSAGEVQQIVRTAADHRVPVIARGAGTGVSGGAHATAGSLVLSLERMNRILSVSAADEVAVVEPGVVNADLNAAAAVHGLMYAPDPASHRYCTIGGNIATNAGGLRCAKYGVTRDSVLALEVVLADGSLISTGHRTFKGVAGYDLTGLFVGSEGTLGIVVGATVRLRYLPLETRTLAVFFPDLQGAAAGVLAVGAARIQPAIMELLDRASLRELDRRLGSDLLARGNTLLLIQTDGFGADAEAAAITAALGPLGGTVRAEDPQEAVRLLDLRRNSRSMEADAEQRVGEDVAVPRSRLVDYIAELERMATVHGVGLRVVAHAGDGNLHPTFWGGQDDDGAGDGGTNHGGAAGLQAALDESIDVALAMGGTITGEHGVGQYKLRWLPLEQRAEVLDLQRRIRSLFDPLGILNPGKAV